MEVEVQVPEELAGSIRGKGQSNRLRDGPLHSLMVREIVEIADRMKILFLALYMEGSLVYGSCNGCLEKKKIAKDLPSPRSS